VLCLAGLKLFLIDTSLLVIPGFVGSGMTVGGYAGAAYIFAGVRYVSIVRRWRAGGSGTGALLTGPPRARDGDKRAASRDRGGGDKDKVKEKDGKAAAAPTPAAGSLPGGPLPHPPPSPILVPVPQCLRTDDDEPITNGSLHRVPRPHAHGPIDPASVPDVPPPPAGDGTPAPGQPALRGTPSDI